MRERATSLTLFSAIVAAIGGFLFGYNTSVISGALLYMTGEMSLTTFNQEIIVSIVLIGALLGAFFGGQTADRIGRKLMLFATCILFFIGTVLIISAHSMEVVVIGRFMSGLGLGICSVSVPLYIAEISPPKIRGMLVSFNQLAITMGILAAYITNYGFSGIESWRWMFAFEFLFITIFFICLFFIPETPSYLASKGHIAKAEKLKHALGHGTKLEEGHIAATQAERKEKMKWSVLFKKPVLLAFFIGIGMSIFQQITGINTIIYYAPRIFQHAGFVSFQSSLLATVGVGVINVVMTIVALYLIDKVGRRPLLIVGLIGMTVCLLSLGTFFFYESAATNIASTICLMGYIAFFAISLGPIAWLIISEIYPLEIRGKAMGIAVTANWTFNFFVSVSFLTLIETIGTSGAFWLYGVICIIAFLFVYYFVPETKGKTFVEIQKFFKS